MPIDSTPCAGHTPRHRDEPDTVDKCNRVLRSYRSTEPDGETGHADTIVKASGTSFEWEGIERMKDPKL
ncbi:hypothetical protein CH299_27915 [Rhodococcus sp. 14-2686-1-2]|nr:hypothetical protein CH301_27395 [Rhodococcus sp. 15-1189-1-1a]OZF08297.1 hypothetical protein CH299_27915 [Rhodococcus sp. 14-2686-1-2]